MINQCKSPRRGDLLPQVTHDHEPSGGRDGPQSPVTVFTENPNSREHRSRCLRLKA
jgi:hypothetical protein